MKVKFFAALIVFSSLILYARGEKGDLHFAKFLSAKGAGGPDEYGYWYIDSNEPGGPVYSWIGIAPAEGGSGTLVANGDNVNSGLLSILPPAGFWFYGTIYNQLAVCSNGWVSFTDGSSVLVSGTIPNTWSPNATVAPFWNDLDPTAGGSIYYYPDTLNNRTIIEWYQVMHYNSTSGPYSFEIILDGSDSSITFQYNSGNPDWTDYATIGIEDEYGNIGLTVPQTNLADNYAVRFYYFRYDDNVGVKSIKLPKAICEANVPLSPEAVVKNYGNNTETFNITCEIDSAGTTVYTDTKTVSSLASDSAVNVVFNPWNLDGPNNVYAVTIYTQLAGDAYPQNDALSINTLSGTTVIGPKWADSTVTIDGTINASEWADAQKVDVSDVLGKSWDNTPDSARTVYMYFKNDGSYLYIAWDYIGDTLLDNWDGVWLFMDENSNGVWESDDSEGEYEIYYNGSTDTTFFTAYPSWNSYEVPGAQVSIALGTHIQGEARIPIGSDNYEINTVLGDTIALQLYVYDGGTGQYGGWWWQENTLNWGPGGPDATVFKQLLLATNPGPDAGIISIDNPLWYATPGVPINPEATVKNTGGVGATFDVVCLIDSAGTRVYTDTVFGINLNPSEQTQITFSAFWTPASAGNTYTDSVFVVFPGDVNPNNDTLVGSILSFDGIELIGPKWADSTVTIDGTINASEWADAQKVDVSDVLGKSWDNTPDSARTVNMYFKNDGSYLYIAWDYIKDTLLDNGDGVYLWVDENNNDKWENDNTEGEYELYYNGTQGVIELSTRPNWLWHSVPSGSTAFSLGAHLQGEARIPIGSDTAEISATLGDTLGIHLAVYDAGSGEYGGWWWQETPYSGLFWEPEPPNFKSLIFAMASGSDVGVVSIDNPLWYATPGVPINPEATVKNTGGVGATFNVVCLIDSAGTRVYTDTVFGINLNPSEQTQITFSASWTPASAGNTYTDSVFVVFPGDVNPNNDTLVGSILSFDGIEVIRPKWADSTVTIDGTINAWEWADAQKVDVSDVLGKSWDNTPDSAGTAYMYFKNDGSYLYIAWDYIGDTLLDNGDGVRLFMDENSNGVWESDESEGEYDITYNGGVNISFTAYPTWNWYGVPGAQASIALGTHIQGEARIPIGSDNYEINTVLGDTIALQLYVYDGGTGQYGGWWWQENTLSWAPGGPDPSSFKNLVLAAPVGGKPFVQPPRSFYFTSPYPNPARTGVTVKYQLPEKSRVKLKIYNLVGQLVKTLVDDIQPPGYYRFRWDGKSKEGIRIPSGIYFIRLEAGKFVDTKKVVFLR